MEIVFDDKQICCGKDSALEDSVQSSDPKSLKDIAGRLQGRHLLSDGRPLMVTVEYLTPDQINAGHLIYMLRENHAPLMMWNSHLFLVNGLSCVESIDSSDARDSLRDPQVLAAGCALLGFAPGGHLRSCNRRREKGTGIVVPANCAAIAYLPASCCAGNELKSWPFRVMREIYS